MKSVETIRVELTNDIDTSWFSDVSTMFASAYGENYRGDDSLRRKILEGDIFFRYCYGGVISAGLVADKGRITFIGVGRNERIDRARSSIMTDLLEIARADSNVDWMSIGVQYSRMEQIAIQSGMIPLRSGDKVIRRVRTIGEADKYNIEITPESVIVVKRDNGYRQQIWTWEDKDEE